MSGVPVVQSVEATAQETTASGHPAPLEVEALDKTDSFAVDRPPSIREYARDHGHLIRDSRRHCITPTVSGAGASPTHTTHYPFSKMDNLMLDAPTAAMWKCTFCSYVNFPLDYACYSCKFESVRKITLFKDKDSESETDEEQDKDEDAKAETEADKGNEAADKVSEDINEADASEDASKGKVKAKKKKKKAIKGREVLESMQCARMHEWEVPRTVIGIVSLPMPNIVGASGCEPLRAVMGAIGKGHHRTGFNLLAVLPHSVWSLNLRYQRWDKVMLGRVPPRYRRRRRRQNWSVIAAAKKRQLAAKEEKEKEEATTVEIEKTGDKTADDNEANNESGADAKAQTLEECAETQAEKDSSAKKEEAVEETSTGKKEEESTSIADDLQKTETSTEAATVSKGLKQEEAESIFSELKTIAGKQQGFASAVSELKKKLPISGESSTIVAETMLQYMVDSTKVHASTDPTVAAESTTGDSQKKTEEEEDADVVVETETSTEKTVNVVNDDANVDVQKLEVSCEKERESDEKQTDNRPFLNDIMDATFCAIPAKDVLYRFGGILPDGLLPASIDDFVTAMRLSDGWLIAKDSGDPLAITSVPPEFEDLCSARCVYVEATDSLLLLGGDTNGSVQTGVWQYSFSTRRWTTKAPMQFARNDFGIAQNSAFLFAVGGQSQDCLYLDVVEKYSLASDSWQTVAHFREGVGRARCGAALCGDSELIVAGGTSPCRELVEILDLSKQTWSRLPKCPTTQWWPIVDSFCGGKVVATAGLNSAKQLNTVHFFDRRQPTTAARYWQTLDVSDAMLSRFDHLQNKGIRGLLSYQ